MEDYMRALPRWSAPSEAQLRSTSLRSSVRYSATRAAILGELCMPVSQHALAFGHWCECNRISCHALKDDNVARYQ
jgi:hypothetical protein